MFKPFEDIDNARIKCLDLDFPQDFCDILAYDSKLLLQLMFLMIILLSTLFPLIYYAKHSNRI